MCVIAVVTDQAPQIFRSTGTAGFLRAIEDAPRRVLARKCPQEVAVHFTATPCLVRTAEGLVHARAADAILTGMSGERWRVSSAHFGRKYEPVAPTVAGESGRYRSRRYQVLALCMLHEFEVILSDGVSHLRGRSGDWLVDYGDGSLGIVAPLVFDRTYEIVG